MHTPLVKTVTCMLVCFDKYGGNCAGRDSHKALPHGAGLQSVSLFQELRIFIL